ncbi:hypothetical protein RI367_005213 [Sorochytrium milnesiophthora]
MARSAARPARKAQDASDDDHYVDNDEPSSADSLASDLSDVEELPKAKPKAKRKPRKKAAASTEDGQGIGDEEQGEGLEEDDDDPIGKSPRKRTKAALDPQTQMRRGMVPFSPYALCAPKPNWTGRLGYACLNMYTRQQKPSIFCSRTCRLAKIKAEGIDVAKELGRQNTLDLAKLVQWNEDHGIKFMRVSSEMFPFASHDEYGYSLDYAAKELAQVGELAKKYGHRLTSHPGQFTQLGSPNKGVVANSLLDLKYHAQMFELMGMDQDSVMILHMGGKFEGKKETLERFEHVFTKLLVPGAQQRLVLENDELGYTILDLLPTSEKLGIPIVVDWHHDSINPSYVEEGAPTDEPAANGAADDASPPNLRHVSIESLIPRVNAVWDRRGIRVKQHYSEPRGQEGCNLTEWRAHSEKCRGFPPTEGNADVMFEAKHKEQSVFYAWWKFDMDGRRELVEQWAHEGKVLALKDDHLGQEIPGVVERDQRLVAEAEEIKRQKMIAKEQKEADKLARKEARERKKAAKTAVATVEDESLDETSLSDQSVTASTTATARNKRKTRVTASPTLPPDDAPSTTVVAPHKPKRARKQKAAPEPEPELPDSQLSDLSDMDEDGDSPPLPTPSETPAKRTRAAKPRKSAAAAPVANENRRRTRSNGLAGL